ncbi:unnamed protein product [Diplocarpon coronariae]
MAMPWKSPLLYYLCQLGPGFEIVKAMRLFVWVSPRPVDFGPLPRFGQLRCHHASREPFRDTCAVSHMQYFLCTKCAPSTDTPSQRDVLGTGDGSEAIASGEYGVNNSRHVVILQCQRPSPFFSDGSGVRVDINLRRFPGYRAEDLVPLPAQVFPRVDLSSIADMQLHKRESVTSITPPLPQVGGYVVVVVVGLVFASAMVLVTKILKKTTGEDNSKTEMQVQSPRRQVAGTDPQQSWLWSTAMLGSCLVGYAYGISGPFWFAAGCSPMIVFFALLGISCKLKIPEAHTLLEIVRIRYGTVAHLVFMFLCLVNNLFAVANMLLGASAAIAALTGMHIIAATFLLPVGVVVYTFVGGIKATFLTDYIHTLTIMIVICYLTVKAFTVDEIGSVGQLYDLVVSASARAPIAGNHQGSYMTMTSKKGIYFGLIHVTSNFGLVIMDTGFFVKAFAASPRAVVPGYVVGGIAYFAIPWALGTLMSSVAWGIQDQPIWPTYPRAISSQEVGAGLVLPYAAMAIAGKGGAVAVLLVIFMAATSTSSAQIIAVSSIISFDIYRAYFAPDASDRDIIRWSHYGVVIFATIAAAFSTMLHYVGVDLSWTLYMLGRRALPLYPLFLPKPSILTTPPPPPGVVTCPGIFPTVFTLLWRQQSRAAAIIAPLLGLATGMSIWLGSAYALHGTVTIASTGELLPCMYGCLASTFSPLPYSVFITLLQPQRFDWDDFLQEKLALGDADAADASSAALEETEHDEPRSRSDPRWVPYMRRWTTIATLWSAATFLGHFVLWPLPMYAAKYTFTKKASRASSPPLPSDLRFVADGRQFYSAWLVISIIWVWGTLLVAGLYPLIDGRRQILSICRALWKGEREGPESAAESTGADSSKGSTAVSVDAPLPGR